MAEIAEIKEELNYLKVWLGIIVLTTIGLVSWLINHYETTNELKTISAIVSIIFMTIAIVFIDRNIKRKIKSLKDI